MSCHVIVTCSPLTILLYNVGSSKGLLEDEEFREVAIGVEIS